MISQLLSELPARPPPPYSLSSPTNPTNHQQSSSTYATTKTPSDHLPTINITIDMSTTINGHLNHCHLPNQINPQALAGLVAVSLRHVPEARSKDVNLGVKKGLVINGSRNLVVTGGGPAVGEKIVRMGRTAGAGVPTAGVADAGTTVAPLSGENKEEAAKAGTKRKAEEVSSLSCDEGTQSNALMPCRSQLLSLMRKRERSRAMMLKPMERRVFELYIGQEAGGEGLWKRTEMKRTEWFSQQNGHGLGCGCHRLEGLPKCRGVCISPFPMVID